MKETKFKLKVVALESLCTDAQTVLEADNSSRSKIAGCLQSQHRIKIPTSRISNEGKDVLNFIEIAVVPLLKEAENMED